MYKRQVLYCCKSFAPTAITACELETIHNIEVRFELNVPHGIGMDGCWPLGSAYMATCIQAQQAKLAWDEINKQGGSIAQEG